MERDVHIEMERLKNLLVANNIDHETGKRLQHNLEEIQQKEDILAQDMAKIKAQERESYDNQVFLRDSMEDIRQELENMRLEAAQNKKFNENLKFELQNLAQQARPIGRSQGPADNSGVPNYPDVNVDIPNKDVIFQNIRIYLPEVFTAQKIPQLQVSGALLKYNSAKDAQLSTISNMLKDIQFTEDDSIQQRIVYMMRIQTILRNQTNSVDDWKFAIESFSCTEVMDQLQESDPKDYNGLLVVLFDQYEFHAYGKTKIKQLTTFDLNNPYMKPFYSSWIRKYKKYQTFASEVFHTIKKRIVADLEAAKKPELVEQVTTIVTVQKLLQFVQLNTGSILRMASSNNSDELMAIRSKPIYKLQNYSEKGKRLGYCTDCKCLKCKKKRTMKNLVFNKKVNFCRNCSCATCNKNSKQYDDTKRKSIATVNSADVVDFEDSDLDSEVDETIDYSTSDTAVVSGNEDPDGIFKSEFEYINSLDGEARPI